MKPTQQEILEKAYQLWLDLGKPWGLANHIWLRAEKELEEARTPVPTPVVTPTTVINEKKKREATKPRTGNN